MREESNVFILSVDSLQYSYFDEALSAIAAQTDAVEFTNATATASHTSSALPGLTAGVHADTLSTWGLPTYGLAESGDPKPIAEIFSESGYETGLWTDNYLFGPEYNYDRGFGGGNQGKPSWKKRAITTIKNSPLRSKLGALEWAYFNVFKRMRGAISTDEFFYRPAEELNRNALDWLDDLDNDPHFCWIHYMDSHHPYEPPREYIDRSSLNTERSRAALGQLSRDAAKSDGKGFSSEDIADVTAAYRACCAYLEDEITSFVTELIERGHYNPDEDVFVMTADHGECLTPEKYAMIGHYPPAFWEEIVQVPLAISRPDWTPETIDEPVSLIDLVPTILDAVGLPIPDTAEGQAGQEPEEMIAQQTTFASRWSGPDSSPNSLYRGIRSDSGWKVFGTHRENDDRVVLSRYDRAVATDEEAVHISTGDEKPPNSRAAEQWDDLLQQLSSRGAPLDTVDSESSESKVNEEHLRNLGYIE